MNIFHSKAFLFYQLFINLTIEKEVMLFWVIAKSICDFNGYVFHRKHSLTNGGVFYEYSKYAIHK
ncbi:MAG: hypothetical protein SCALA701_36830 [Candidatus Scalindua sp.]|nr:MAG: hypothetical protein SCALA701_36830 [Candidatus Scalindua sp.]